ncbi:MAG: hypothetical protein M3R48_10260 [Candidatus Dormibacteraeota bacterium]|nr:hypothetical protein [Candidatus Dormibacteraeota bacterium]
MWICPLPDGHIQATGRDARGRKQYRYHPRWGEARDATKYERTIAFGDALFQWLDEDGGVRGVESADVNEYIRDAAGEDFTAKDFRTWGGTVLAAWHLRELGEHSTPTEAKRLIVEAVESVACRLGNTTAICRRCYVHPEVINAHLDGTLLAGMQRRAEETLEPPADDLSDREAVVLSFLRRRIAAAA